MTTCPHAGAVRSPSHRVPSNTPTDEDAEALMLERVKHWVERAIIGLNLCPFARRPAVAGRIRYVLSTARTDSALIENLDRELGILKDASADEIETTLLIHPNVLNVFEDYNAFLAIADLAVRMRGLEGVIQIASFHPQYRFDNTGQDDIENFTNRSPAPILHLLRESSVEEALRAMPDTDAIYRRNMETLRALGQEGWENLWKT